MFLEVTKTNAAEMQFADIVFVHDPQPIGLIEPPPGSVVPVGMAMPRRLFPP